MHIIEEIKKIRAIVKQAKISQKRIGFVPTMGALHEGHLSLFRRCRKENHLAIISIFVNPLQFGPREDFKKYPRDLQKDISLAKKENIDIILHPSVKEIYPTRFLTTVHVDKLTNKLCGASRPGHFDGATTVVTKLLNIVMPDTIYLGQKDAQQCVVLQKNITDLNIPVTVKILPTVRERDGLAMSSRNQYLSFAERKQAPHLYQSLTMAKNKILTGERRPQAIVQSVQKYIQRYTQGKIDYVECVNANDLESLGTLKGKVLVALAVWFGKTRLIDNVIVKLPN